MSRYSQKLKDACALCKPEQDFRRHITSLRIHVHPPSITACAKPPPGIFFLWEGSYTGSLASLPVAEDFFVTRSNEGWLYSQAGYISLHNTSFYILIVSQRLTAGARDIRGFYPLARITYTMPGSCLYRVPYFLCTPSSVGMLIYTWSIEIRD